MNTPTCFPKAFMCGLLLAFGSSTLAIKADRVSVSFTDPVEDAFGCPPSAACTTPFQSIIGPVTDVVGLVLSFDNATGNYSILMTASPANPFFGDFIINVNLFNPDTGTTNPFPSFFSDVSNSFSLTTPTTEIMLTGTSSNLLAWQVGDQVAPCAGSGGIIPEPCSTGLGNPSAPPAFQSGVINFEARWHTKCERLFSKLASRNDSPRRFRTCRCLPDHRRG